MSDVNKQSSWFLLAVSAVIGILVLTGVLIGVRAAMAPLFSYQVWVGRKELSVQVLVLDRESLQPVSRADVVLLNGPRSPFETRISNYSKSEFSPNHENAEPQQGRTDGEGRVVLSRYFSAHGRDGLFRDTGWVDTHNVWVQVSADDYGSITLPLDGQSAHLRDIENEFPVYVTLLLTKAKVVKTTRLIERSPQQ